MNEVKKNNKGDTTQCKVETKVEFEADTEDLKRQIIEKIDE